MKTKLLTANNLKPGVRFKYLGIPIEIVRDREPWKDRFGQELSVWWARRLDTGEEGYGPKLGPGGVLRVEPIKSTTRSSKPHHATKKKSPAQLQREIDEVLQSSGGAHPKSATTKILRRPANPVTRVRGFKVISYPLRHFARSGRAVQAADLDDRDESQVFPTLAEAKHALPEIEADVKHSGREALIVELY